MQKRTNRILAILAAVAVVVGIVELAVIVTRRPPGPPARTASVAATSGAEATAAAAGEEPGDDPGAWVAGDYHSHTYLSGGERTQREVAQRAFDRYGLGWLANSDHGGPSDHDARGDRIAARPGWKSILDGSWPEISALRRVYPGKALLQGVEWNVPAHEHAAVAIAADEAGALADFEYMFDANETGERRDGLTRDERTHDAAVRGVAWLQERYRDAAWVIINHPSRQGLFSVADIRDLNDAAPDVCFGFEGIPGHQGGKRRGDYHSPSATYGGADLMLAEVGGAWDALLGEGRRFWVFSGSDFHDPAVGDFWPGEYNVTRSHLVGEGPEAVVASLRSGNVFIAEGGLVDGLDFRASVLDGPGGGTPMGGTLAVEAGSDVEVVVRFRVPKENNNGDRPRVDHVDLIGGDVGERIASGAAGRGSNRNGSTRILTTFTKGAWSAGAEREGWHEVRYVLRDVRADRYLRLRGTNLGANVKDQTDSDGDPLTDRVAGDNDAGKAWADLWFYSNPVFIDVR